MEAEEIDRAHGVLGGHKHERSSIARRQPIPLLNKPAVRPRRAPISPQTLLDGRKPRLGHFDDLFRREGKISFKFETRQHGQWVRTRLLQQASAKGSRRKKFWSLTPEQIATEIDCWFASNQADLRRGKEWADKGRPGVFTPRTKYAIHSAPPITFTRYTAPAPNHANDKALPPFL